MWINLGEKLFEWEIRMNKIINTAGEEHSKKDREYIEKELPLLKTEKKRMELRLFQLEVIIAKTWMLLSNLNEDLCQKLSKGHSLDAVGEALKKKFGEEVNEGSARGRSSVREFLETYYNINSKASRELFALLAEVGILNFRVELSDTYLFQPVLYDLPEEAGMYPEIATELYGKWLINA